MVSKVQASSRNLQPVIVPNSVVLPAVSVWVVDGSEALHGDGHHHQYGSGHAEALEGAQEVRGEEVMVFWFGGLHGRTPEDSVEQEQDVEDGEGDEELQGSSINDVCQMLGILDSPFGFNSRYLLVLFICKVLWACSMPVLNIFVSSPFAVSTKYMKLPLG